MFQYKGHRTGKVMLKIVGVNIQEHVIKLNAGSIKLCWAIDALELRRDERGLFGVIIIMCKKSP